MALFLLYFGAEDRQTWGLFVFGQPFKTFELLSIGQVFVLNVDSTILGAPPLVCYKASFV